MIYLDLKDGHKLLILDPDNIKHLQSGGQVYSPDGSVALLLTPDALWMREQIELAIQAGVLNGELIEILHADSMKREPVLDRPKHAMRTFVRDGKVVQP